jgi:hypothetical protein
MAAASKCLTGRAGWAVLVGPVGFEPTTNRLHQKRKSLVNQRLSTHPERQKWADLGTVVTAVVTKIEVGNIRLLFFQLSECASSLRIRLHQRCV